MGEKRQLGRECAQGGQEPLFNKPEVRLGEPRPYRRPDLVVYGSLAELTRLEGNLPFDGLAGTEGAT
jgi:hypothetical protein